MIWEGTVVCHNLLVESFTANALKHLRGETNSHGGTNTKGGKVACPNLLI